MKLDELREELSNLEHEQWIKWSQAVASELMAGTISSCEIGKRTIEKHQKWLPNWKPYDELDEKTKDFDREWADKVLVLFASFLEAKRKELIETLKRFIQEDIDRREQGKPTGNYGNGVMAAWNEFEVVFGGEKT